MRKLVVLSFFIQITIVSSGQEYKKIFLGEDWGLYKGLYLKYKVGTIGATNHCFYSNFPTERYQVPVYGRTEKYGFVTDTNTIKDREFLVLSVMPFNKYLSRGRYAVFELSDGKETLYFTYDSKYDFNFPFEVKGISSNHISKNIKKLVDPFTDDTTFRTPIQNDMVIIKDIKKGSNKPIYYLKLKTIGSTLTYDGKGVIVLFKDGTKWVKSEQKIDVKVIEGNGWEYNAFIILTKQDLQIFATKEVDKYRLYIYDEYYPDNDNVFMYYSQAIMNIK